MLCTVACRVACFVSLLIPAKYCFHGRLSSYLFAFGLSLFTLCFLALLVAACVVRVVWRVVWRYVALVCRLPFSIRGIFLAKRKNSYTKDLPMVGLSPIFPWLIYSNVQINLQIVVPIYYPYALRLTPNPDPDSDWRWSKSSPAHQSTQTWDL